MDYPKTYDIYVGVLLNGKKIGLNVRSVEELKKLYGLKAPICTVDRILNVFITKDLIILLKEDRAFRDKSVRYVSYGVDRRINNIEAYDWDGNLVWNIGDIIGDIKFGFLRANVIPGYLFEEFYNRKLPEQYNSHELLYCVANKVFVIDLSSNEIIDTFGDRW